MSDEMQDRIDLFKWYLDEILAERKAMTGALEAVRQELDLPEHLAEIVGNALVTR